MNSFIKTVFAVVVGLFVAHLIAIFFIFGLIGAAVEEFMGTEDAVEVQKHTILELDLSTRMVDKVEEDPFKRLNYQTLKMRDLDDDLYSVLKAIAYAEDDRWALYKSRWFVDVAQYGTGVARGTGVI